MATPAYVTTLGRTIVHCNELGQLTDLDGRCDEAIGYGGKYSRGDLPAEVLLLDPMHQGQLSSKENTWMLPHKQC